MKPASLLAAAAVVVTSNLAVLTHAAWNRLGGGEAEVVLSNRQMHLWRGRTLSLSPTLMRWEVPDAALLEIGLDIGPASDCEPYSDMCDAFEDRLGRPCVLALQRSDSSTLGASPCWLGSFGPIDIAPSAAPLRARYPDRRRVILVPAAVRYGGPSGPGRSIVWLTLSWNVYVPEPVRRKIELLEAEEWSQQDGPGPPCPRLLWWVHLRYGRLLDPWVDRIEFEPR